MNLNMFEVNEMILAVKLFETEKTAGISELPF